MPSSQFYLVHRGLTQLPHYTPEDPVKFVKILHLLLTIVENCLVANGLELAERKQLQVCDIHKNISAQLHKLYHQQNVNLML